MYKLKYLYESLEAISDWFQTCGTLNPVVGRLVHGPIFPNFKKQRAMPKAINILAWRTSHDVGLTWSTKKKDGRSEAEAISDAPEKRAGSDWISDEPFADVLYHLPGGVAGNLLFHPYMGVFYFIFTTCIISEIGYVYTERNSPKMETMKKGARGCDRYS